LINALSAPKLSPEKSVELAVEYYSPFLQETFDDFPRRQQELEQLVSMASRYKNLGIFLDDLSVEPPASTIDIRSADSKGNANHLTLSTIHSAKGLEWRAVFIIWLVDGRFPIGKSFKNIDNLEEELRLLYVAATRAKDKLFLVYPGQEIVRNSGGWGSNYQMGLSSFIRALPQDVIQHHSITASHGHVYNMAPIPGPSTNSLHMSSTESSKLKPGDRVTHPAFGIGVVARFMGEEKVEIIFKDRGIKLLHLGYTSLEKI
jgi:DNA helicase-2/ATP-dependent DNA helicase PcrA